MHGTCPYNYPQVFTWAVEAVRTTKKYTDKTAIARIAICTPSFFTSSSHYSYPTAQRLTAPPPSSSANNHQQTPSSSTPSYSPTAPHPPAGTGAHHPRSSARSSKDPVPTTPTPPTTCPLPLSTAVFQNAASGNTDVTAIATSKRGSRAHGIVTGQLGTFIHPPALSSSKFPAVLGDTNSI